MTFFEIDGQAFQIPEIVATHLKAQGAENERLKLALYGDLDTADSRLAMADALRAEIERLRVELERFTNGVTEILSDLERDRIGDAMWTCEALLACIDKDFANRRRRAWHPR